MTQVTGSEGRRKLTIFQQYKDAVSNSWANILLLSSHNPLWGFDYSIRSCQAHLSITTFVQFFTSKTLIPLRTSSHHLFLGCPLDLFPIGLHSKILRAILYSSILCTCPHLFNRLTVTNLTMLAPPINLFNSWLVQILHPSLSWRRPKIFLGILLSKIIK